MIERIKALLTEWHDAGRDEFERSFGNLNYDMYERKSFKDRLKFICLDVGTSGAFMVRKSDGLIFRIKGYGVPHLKKVVGHINAVTGSDLNKLRAW